MKVLMKRAYVLLIFSLLLVAGLLVFTVQYINNASTWAHYPTNRHFYTNGQLLSSGTVFDRSGAVLVQSSGGGVNFHDNKTVRTAVMHATGDLHGNVATSVQVAFRGKLSGWDLVNGAYHFDGKTNRGSDLTLTLDAGLCGVAYNALAGRRGTVGVYNYKTGEILCMVSSPSIDPADPPKDLQAYPEKYEGVYLNRFLSAAYTPGSVFKLVTAAAALDSFNDIESELFYCDGHMQIGEDKVTCLSAHGEVNLKQALARSCNTAFAEISLKLGMGKLQKYADLAGFNSYVRVNGIKTETGRVDVSGAEGADLAWAGIGQYTNTANPLNFMAYIGAIANEGVSVNPKILKQEGRFASLIPSRGESRRMLPADTAEKLGELMRNNTLSSYGEGHFPGLELCAKSGTAEVGGEKRPHAWFAGFLDREDLPLAFVVVVENGGAGREVAGPIAAEVLQAAANRLK